MKQLSLVTGAVRVASIAASTKDGNLTSVVVESEMEGVGQSNVIVLAVAFFCVVLEVGGWTAGTFENAN
jgi:hypothetical protein